LLGWQMRLYIIVPILCAKQGDEMRHCQRQNYSPRQRPSYYGKNILLGVINCERMSGLLQTQRNALAFSRWSGYNDMCMPEQYLLRQHGCRTNSNPIVLVGE